MRIGVDATSWDNPRGFGRFARSVVERLVALDRTTTYVMLAPPSGSPLPDGSVTVGQRRSAVRAAEGARPPHELLELAVLARRARLDAVLFPSVYSWFPTPGVPSVVGVHDAIAATLPELTLPSRRARVLWAAKERWAIRSCARLFTVSAAARVVLAERWGVPVGTIAVVPEAPAPCFSPVGADVARAALAGVGLEVGEPFLAFAGGVSPHKRIDVLLDALERAPGLPRLVVVGDLEDRTFLSASGDVTHRAAAPGLAGRVLLPGHVSDATLAALFTHATAVVLPSRAEGFGLPAVEAAACGAPLVLSDIPAHRETLDGAARFVPVGDAAALARALQQVVEDPALRAELSGRGRRAVAGLSWDAGARVLQGLLADAGAQA